MQAELVACFSAATQAIWLRNLIKELTVFDFVDRPIQLYCDNNSAVLFVNNNRCLKGSKHMECHAPNPGPTRLADPNRFPGRETQEWDFFFLKQNRDLWVWPTSYNIIKILYIFTESHLHIQTELLHLQSERGPTCSEPLQVCWPSCMRMFADVFSCTYMD